MTRWLMDPDLFSYVIMGMYALNVARWAFERNPFGVCYWLSALGITASVTFLTNK